MFFLRRTTVIMFTAVLILVAGCRSGDFPQYYFSEEVDFAFIKRVAVMPLTNLTDDRFAAEKVRHIVISELLATGFVDVVHPGEVMEAINAADIKSVESLTTDQIKELGKNLNVQGLIIGSVERFGEVRMGNATAPEVTITLMMADVTSGSIIWSTTRTRGGAGFMARHFGARAETMSETVLFVIRDALKTLYEY